ncbi:hypothetical protein D3C72_970030 [compost metagenome]
MNLAEFIDVIGSRNSLHKCFYHFTDSRNLPGIREHGLLSMAELRRRSVVPPAPGGNQWSWEADVRSGMDGYVHLCFFDNHPMEWRAKQEGRIGDSLFLKVDPSVIQLDGVLISEHVSNKADAIIKPAAEALDEIDLEVIYTRTDWRSEEIKERMKVARVYEVLIPTKVDARMLQNLD